jgi:putative ABC transport system permease protein
MATSNELGPIWRSIRRHRSFTLLIVEVALGFFIIGNLVMTMRWYMGKTLPPPGHRQDDVVEVTVRRPLRDDDGPARLRDLRWRERAALQRLPGVRDVAAVSSTQIDDRWGFPGLFWTEAGAARGPSRCAGVERAQGDTVAGWDVATEPALARVIDLTFVEGDARALLAADTVIVTRCLAEALFGDAPGAALGHTLWSTRRLPARITAVVEDVRLRVPLLYQTQVTALYATPDDDARLARYLLRTEPDHAHGVRAAVGPAIAAVDGDDPDRRVEARLFEPETTVTAGNARGTVIVLAVVGGIMGTLAVLGNLAVAAFLVGDRRRVIGVRRALGATRWDIFRYLLIENLIPTQLGNLLGLVTLLATLPAARARFSGIRFTLADALATAFLLTLGGVLAKLLPALRATRIPPSEVTRSL